MPIKRETVSVQTHRDTHALDAMKEPLSSEQVKREKDFLGGFVLFSRLSFLPDPLRGISWHSMLPFDHADPGEVNSAGAVVSASPPHLLPLPPLSVSLFMVGIATGVRLVRDGPVVSLFFFPLLTPSLCVSFMLFRLCVC